MREVGGVATHNEASLAMGELAGRTANKIAMTISIIARRDMAVRSGCGGRIALKHSLIQSVQLHDFDCNYSSSSLQLACQIEEEERKNNIIPVYYK